MLTKKFKIVTLCLIFSASLNIFFSILFFVKESNFEITSLKKDKIVLESSLIETLVKMKDLSYKELLSFLTNKTLVEEGLTKRDLALSALVSFYYFDIERALKGASVEIKEILLEEEKKVFIFPSIDEKSFDAILNFAYLEKWPLNARGLFYKLKKGIEDPSLKKAFFHTKEFFSLKRLFQKTGFSLSEEKLLSLALEGSFSTLAHFQKEEMQVLDFSLEKRRQLLLEYVANGSKVGAELLLESDFSFALKRLENEGVEQILHLIDPKSPIGEKYCKEVTLSLRKNEIKEKIIEKPKPEKESHLVEAGESLWKISKKYSVSLEALREANHLEKDAIYPGMKLLIP